jgi:outer membrane protein, heavy metal efflux system
MILPGLFAGCAGYHPKPLNDPGLDPLITPPDQAQLAQAAASLRHPKLRPITIDFSKGLTEEALGVIAVLVSPELKSLRAQEQVAEAQVFAAGLLPDPQFSGSLDFPTGGATGLVTAYTLGLSWDIASLVTKPIEQRIAKAQAQQVHYGVAWQEWLLAHQARLLARRVAFLQRQSELARQAADIAAHLLEVTRHNREQGDVKIDEVGLRQVAYLDAHDRAPGFAREVEKARQELNQTLGLPPSEQFSLAPIEVIPLRHANGNDLFASARRQRLDLIALQAGYENQETSLYRATLGQYPGFSIGFGAARDTSNIITRGGNLSLDIPIFNRNRGNIGVAAATREQLYRECQPFASNPGRDRGLSR